MTSATTGEERSHRAIVLLLVPLMLVLFISTLDQTIVATAIAGIGHSLHDAANAPWIATAYLLTSAVTTLIFGKLGDMYGRKRVFLFSIAVFLAGSLVCGLAGSLGLLIVFRAVQGIGGGGLNSLVQAITGDLIPARQRAKYQSWLGIVSTLAIIVGPLLGGLFVDSLSWRLIFFVNLPIGLVALAVIGARLHLPVQRAQRSVDVGGGLLATLFTTAVLLVTTWGGDRFAWDSAPILVLIAAAVLALVGYLGVERRVREPITPPHLFRDPVFGSCGALFFLSTAVLFAAMLYVPQLMQTVYGFSAFDAGLFLIPLLVGLIGATALAGPLIARTGRYKLLPIVGAVLTGAGTTALGLAGASTPPWQLAVLLFVIGAGIGPFVQVALLAGQNTVEHRDLGVATGALNFFKTLGGAFGSALFGAVLAARIGSGALAAFHTVFLGTVPLLALGLVLAVVMREKPLSEEVLDIAEGRLEVSEY